MHQPAQESVITHSATQTRSDLEISRAVHLATVEIVFGSIGHGLKLPLAGQFLSLYQLNVLSNALNKDQLPASSTFEISGIVGVLKSLSPAGQKVGPMFSIMMQGFLYWLGLKLAGAQLLGQILGASFASLWAFIQPLVTGFIIFGANLVFVFEHYNSKLQNEYSYIQSYLVLFVAAIMAAKLVLAWFIVLQSYYRKKEWRLRTDLVARHVIKAQPSTRVPWRGALRDMTRPVFILSFILMFIFILQLGSSVGTATLLTLRSIAIAFVLFYFLRSPLLVRAVNYLSQRSARFRSFSLKSEKVLKQVQAQLRI